MKTAVFAGTYEGRLLCERLSAEKIEACAYVASSYGVGLLAGLAGINVVSGRLDEGEIAEAIAKEGFALVVDATHPYAREVTLNIRSACRRTGSAYVRFLRGEDSYSGVIHAGDTLEAAEKLAGTTGNILLTTGSKELAIFCRQPGLRERLFARVLPVAEVIEHCYSLGLSGRQIIAMQGPFSQEMNVAMLKEFSCRWLVTKNTGEAGGVAAKIAAAQEAGVEALLIGRPLKEDGYGLEEVLVMIRELAERGKAL